jgi:hypothetical protein
VEKFAVFIDSCFRMDVFGCIIYVCGWMDGFVIIVRQSLISNMEFISYQTSHASYLIRVTYATYKGTNECLVYPHSIKYQNCKLAYFEGSPPR